MYLVVFNHPAMVHARIKLRYIEYNGTGINSLVADKATRNIEQAHLAFSKR